MTTVITRLFADKKTADMVANRLTWEGFPKSALRVIADADDALHERMESARVDEAARPVYAEKIGAGAALLVVHATYKPLGAARIAREVTERAGAIDVGAVPDDTWFPDGPERAPSILKDHPRFMTLPLDPEDYRGGPISRELGIPLLARKRKRNSAMRGGGHMSRFFWPMPLVIRKRSARSAISGGAHMSRFFWPMPLVTTKKRKNSVIRGGALPLSRALGWPTISSRN